MERGGWPAVSHYSTTGCVSVFLSCSGGEKPIIKIPESGEIDLNPADAFLTIALVVSVMFLFDAFSLKAER